MDKPKFLDKVKVKQFTYSSSDSIRRRIHKNKNPNLEEIFTVIGTVNLKEGYIDYDYDEGNRFVQTGTKQVFIVAKSIGVRFKASIEDIEILVKEAG